MSRKGKRAWSGSRETGFESLRPDSRLFSSTGRAVDTVDYSAWDELARRDISGPRRPSVKRGSGSSRANMAEWRRRRASNLVTRVRFPLFAPSAASLIGRAPGSYPRLWGIVALAAHAT